MSTPDLTGFSGVCMFTADWCGPCSRIKPTIRSEVSALVGRERLDEFFRPINIDDDEAAALAQQYGVRSIPVIMFFVDGAPIADATVVGANDALVRAGISRLADAGVGRKKTENQIDLPVCADATVACQGSST